MIPNEDDQTGRTSYRKIIAQKDNLTGRQTYQEDDLKGIQSQTKGR